VGMKPRNIQVHIDNLVLHGFGQVNRHRVGAAVQRELVRLIHGQGMPSFLNQTQVIGNMNAGEFEIRQSTGANSVGTQVAQKIYQGMER
jgi:hypothetical protein